jgi:hypothetical protein
LEYKTQREEVVRGWALDAGWHNKGVLSGSLLTVSRKELSLRRMVSPHNSELPMYHSIIKYRKQNT